MTLEHIADISLSYLRLFSGRGGLLVMFPRIPTMVQLHTHGHTASSREVPRAME